MKNKIRGEFILKFLIVGDVCGRPGREAFRKYVPELKKEHNVAVFQPDRWKQIKDNSVKAGVSLGLSEDFVDKLLQAIHQESVAQQNQIMVKKEEKI